MIRSTVYTLQHTDDVKSWLSQRTAESHAFFLLPYLAIGSTLLDCGCGTGSITCDLAKRVYPGRVVGIDTDPAQLAFATETARKQELKNIEFKLASVYELPYADHTFDIAFAHAVLMHLDGVPALTEIRRVMKPGGIVGISDPDFGGLLCSGSPAMENVHDLFCAVIRNGGGDPTYGRHLRRLLLSTGENSRWPAVWPKTMN